MEMLSEKKITLAVSGIYTLLFFLFFLNLVTLSPQYFALRDAILLSFTPLLAVFAISIFSIKSTNDIFISWRRIAYIWIGITAPFFILTVLAN